MKEQKFILRSNSERDLTRVVAVLSAAPKDKDLQVTIGPAKKDRSADQNSSLYGVAYKALSEFTGYTAPELHDCFLRAYFGEVEVEVMNRRFTKPRRTTTTDEAGERKLLSTVEFNAFYKFIQQKGAEIGCWVPDPDPLWHQVKEERASRAA
jgi:hypothetical protein